MDNIKHKLTHLYSHKTLKHSEPSESYDHGAGRIDEELEVPFASDIVFRKLWKINNFHETVAHKTSLDSPMFRCSVNGTTTLWKMSIRFWTGPNGKKILNPLVVCLTLIGCETETNTQARVRFQFGVWDVEIKCWEFCPISNMVLNLQNTKELLSIGYKSLGIHERHVEKDKNITIMTKIQIIGSEEEKHSLSQDLARILQKTSNEYIDTIIFCGTHLDMEKESSGEDDGKITELISNDSIEYGDLKTELYANSLIIKARSPMLAVMLIPYHHATRPNLLHKLDLNEISFTTVQEIVRYMYTDKVDNIEMNAARLLPLSIKFCMAGLQALCERALFENLTPANVPNILLLADQCKCENLRQAILQYCENSEIIKDNVVTGKGLAWRVMEMVNPDLFLEACENIGSSSSNVDSPTTPGSLSDI